MDSIHFQWLTCSFYLYGHHVLMIWCTYRFHTHPWRGKSKYGQVQTVLRPRPLKNMLPSWSLILSCWQFELAEGDVSFFILPFLLIPDFVPSAQSILQRFSGVVDLMVTAARHITAILFLRLYPTCPAGSTRLTNGRKTVRNQGQRSWDGRFSGIAPSMASSLLSSNSSAICP